MDYSKELAPDVREKMKKNLVYVGIFSIVMLFAGLTSAYYVNMGGGFWLKYPMPSGFYLSTLSISLSSLCFILALGFAKRNKMNLVKWFVSLTLVFGIGFVGFQMKGYQQLVAKGIHVVNTEIIITDGRYGSYFEIKYKGSFLQVDGNDYMMNGRKLSKQEMNELQKFMAPYCRPDQKNIMKARTDKNFQLLLRNEPLLIKNNAFYINDSVKMPFIDEIRLGQLATNIQFGRGDFVTKGKYGEDFVVYFKGKKLEYKNRQLMYKGKILSPYLQIKASETSDNASAFLYILTILHLLHVGAALLYLSKLVISSFRNKYSSEDFLSLKLGAIFWHFLGLLWLYLLLFLIFIH